MIALTFNRRTELSHIVYNGKYMISALYEKANIKGKKGT